MDYKALYEQSQKENEELKKQLDEKQEELNEESQQRLKNKECWMSVKDKYWEVRKQNDELKKENERLERLRITFINRYGELKKIVCPDSQFQDHKRIREGCLKLKEENEKLNSFINELKVNVVKLD